MAQAQQRGGTAAGVDLRPVVPLKQPEAVPAASYLITPDWSEQNERWPVWPAAVGTPVD